MLKKAGIVVLGATAGMLSLAPLASAGEASHGGHDHDRGHHGEHDRDPHRGGGDCDKIAYSRGDSLVNLSNVLANADVQDVNVASIDGGGNEGCGGDDDDRDGRHGHRHHDDDHDGDRGDRGGRGGDRVAISEGDSLVNASNLLANPTLEDINVLSLDG
jgi:hypothetical protein